MLARAALVLSLLAALVACGRPPVREVAVDTLFDPQLLAVDAAAPTQRFEGDGASLIQLDGWAQDESVRYADGTFGAAWVLGESAELQSVGSWEGPIDLYFRARPYAHPDGEPQTMELRVNGENAGSAVLPVTWNEGRIEIPEGLLVDGVNRFELVFSYFVQPTTIGRPDNRELAAQFAVLSLVPRGLAEPFSFVHAPRLDPAAREVTLPPGGAFELPLPPGASGRFAPTIGAAPEPLPMEVWVARPDGGREPLWRGEVAPGDRPEIEFEALEDGGMARLGVRLGDLGRAADGEPATLSFAPDTLEIRPPRAARNDRPPHLFVYMIDTLRADGLGVYGSETGVSPRIDAFAEEAVVYLDAWSASSWTLPSTVSLLTGIYPFGHGVMEGNVPLAADGPATLADRLGRIGYATFGFSHSFVAGPKFGVETGFDAFTLANELGGWTQRSQEARQHLLQWMAGGWRGEPIFAYLHTVDPHAPYGPTPRGAELVDGLGGTLGARDYLPHKFNRGIVEVNETEIAVLRGLYAGEIEHADAEFGRFVDLLRYLGLYDDSIIVLVSDHGEEFGDHGAFDHGRTVWEEMVRVPLVVKYPGSAGAGEKIERRVSTVDLVPTVLRLAGAEIDESLHGEPLPLASGERRNRRAVLTEVSPAKGRWVEAVDFRALGVEATKCVENALESDQFGLPEPRWQTYDLESDPRETAPLPADDPRSERCRELLERWRAMARAEAPGEVEEALDDEARAALRALGYVD